MAGDPEVIGKSITVGSSSVTVVGVLPDGFDYLDNDFDLWFPIALSESDFQNCRSHTMRVVARMKPNVTLEDAQSDMDRVVAGLSDVYPQFLTGWGINVVSMTDEVVGEIRPALLVLLGAVGLVLLIAAVNVANLMLARTTAEQHEMAIRTALGTGHDRLVQQKLTESVVLALVGIAVGVIGAATLTRFQASLLFGIDSADPLTYAGLSLLLGAVALLATYVPARRASKVDPMAALRE